MHTTLTMSELDFYLNNLIQTNFPLPRPIPPVPQAAHLHALDRLEYCFNNIRRKYYFDDRGTVFDPLNGDHLCTYLWFLSNTVAASFSIESLSIALSQLNKRLHAVDLFYQVSMPDIFLLVHPVGSVFGNASYGNYFVGYQNCTIGSDCSSYPTLGDGVICYSRTSILGSCFIGSNVVFAANSFLLNTNVPSNTLVTGSYPVNRFLNNNRQTISRSFNSLS